MLRDCHPFRLASFSLMVVVSTACSPTLNWRDVRLSDDGRLHALFPCRPRSEMRPVNVAGRELAMRLHACRVEDVSYSVAVASAEGPAQAMPVITAWAELQMHNLGAVVSGEIDWAVKGADPSVGLRLRRLAGKLPDGSSVQQQSGFFAKGALIFQVSVTGRDVDPDAASIFFESFEWRVKK